MRVRTQASIDALHAQVEALVLAEKVWHDAKHPGEPQISRRIAHTAIEVAARSPADRAGMYWATATLPHLD